MFTFVKLKNFMSIQDAFFDFSATKKTVKRFIALYGENGSGKSNFVNSISFLRRSIESFQMAESFAKLQDAFTEKEMSYELFNDFLGDFMRFRLNFSAYMEDCRMIDCEDETRLEYGFQIDNHHGTYEIAFRDTFTYERLYYFTGKQSGQLYEVKHTGDRIVSTLSSRLCATDSIQVALENKIQEYWGKHTLLSILNDERKKKNSSYIGNSYLSHTFDLIDMLECSMIHQKEKPVSTHEIRSIKPYNMLEDLGRGSIPLKSAYILDFSERILNDFFTQTYSDIKNVYYRRTEKKRKIEYQLYAEKMIGGKIRVIPFQKESAGTQQVLEIVRSILGVFCGVTVIYDEIDNGIHDLLLKNILSSMLDDITGQLIITTHNTFLLEELDIKSIYVIDVNYEGKKEVHCLSEFPRIYGSNNPRRMYLKGLFGGVPLPEMVDYSEIIGELEELENGREE